MNIVRPLCVEIGRSEMCPHECVQPLCVLRPQINVRFGIDVSKCVLVFEKNLNTREKFRTINVKACLTFKRIESMYRSYQFWVREKVWKAFQ